MRPVIQEASSAHLGQIAALWHQGWIDGHAAVVPAALAALRTHDDLLDRATQFLERTRVALNGSKVVGFSMAKTDELYQLYVSPDARGSGTAMALIRDFEDRMRAAGHKRIWLACAIGNDRAARFYTKAGWENIGEEIVELDTPEGPYPLKLWRFETAL